MKNRENICAPLMLIMAIAAPSPAAAKSEDWKTVQGWVITRDVEDQSCGAITIYEGEGQTVLNIVYEPSTDTAQVSLGNKGWVSLKEGVNPSVHIDLGSQGSYDAVKTKSFTTTGYYWLSMSFHGAQFLADIAIAPYINFSRGEIVVDKLNLKGTKTVIPELIRCATSINKGIALDPFAKDATSSASATGGRVSQAAALRGNPAQFFGPDNYPPGAQRAGAEGRTVANLTVGTDGRVTNCAVMTSSGNSELDAATCRISLMRVRFAPAKDDQGNPVASSYTLPVRWLLPVPEPTPPAPAPIN